MSAAIPEHCSSTPTQALADCCVPGGAAPPSPGCIATLLAAHVTPTSRVIRAIFHALTVARCLQSTHTRPPECLPPPGGGEGLHLILRGGHSADCHKEGKKIILKQEHPITELMAPLAPSRAVLTTPATYLVSAGVCESSSECLSAHGEDKEGTKEEKVDDNGDFQLRRS